MRGLCHEAVLLDEQNSLKAQFRGAQLVWTYAIHANSLPFAVQEEIGRPTDTVQTLPGMGWLTDTELRALMTRAPIGEPHTSEQYHLLVAANAARAEAMRRALRPQR